MTQWRVEGSTICLWTGDFATVVSTARHIIFDTHPNWASMDSRANLNAIENYDGENDLIIPSIIRIERK